MALAEVNVSTICERQTPKNEVEMYLLSFQCGSFEKGSRSNQAGGCSMSATSEEYMERGIVSDIIYLFILEV